MGGKAYLGHLRKGQFGNGLNRGLKISQLFSSDTGSGKKAPIQGNRPYF